MDRLLVIDTETGGVDPAKYSILSLAAIVWRPGGEGEACEIFIAEPEIVSEPGALSVNQIDLEWLRTHGEPPNIAVERVQEFLRRAFGVLGDGETVSLVGHNVAFDVGFLRRLYRLGQQDFDRVFSHRVVDTASVARFLMLAGRLPIDLASSTKLFEHFGIRFDPKERHSALGDARATGRLLDEMIKLVRS